MASSPGSRRLRIPGFTSPSPYPQVAASFALAKFGLLLFSAAYSLVGGLALLRRR